jgi:hypothetical protein
VELQGVLMPLESLREFLLELAVRYPASSAIAEICQTGADAILDSPHRAQILQHHGRTSDPETHKHLLDLVLEYVNKRLEAGGLTEDDARGIRLLKAMFGIAEGDFFMLRPREVQQVLINQLEQILFDGLIETSEEAAQAELQRAFDLSFDQYLRLTRAEYERGIARLQLELTTIPKEAAKAGLRRLELLQAVVTLASQHPRSVGGLT